MIDARALESLTMDLMRIPSVTSDLHACQQAVAFCRAYLQALPGVSMTMYENGGHPSIVATYGAEKNPAVLLSAHIDVVPAPEAAFTPLLEKGLIHGRGAYDMKGPAATLLQAFSTVVQEKWPVSLGIMLTTDEEIGGHHGVKHLVEDIGYRPGCVVLPDGGQDMSIVEIQYGVLRLRNHTRGKAAHSSRPEEGSNAITTFIDRFQELRERAKDLPETIVTLATIQGGIALNVIPDHCEAGIDVRSAKPEVIRSIIKDIFPEDECIIELDEPAFRLDTEDPCVQHFKNLAALELGRDVKFIRERGASDARFFSPYNIPVIVMAPRGGGHHQDHEWVDSASLATFERILLSFLRDVSEGRVQPRKASA